MRWVRGVFIGLTTLIAYAILVQQLLAVAQRLPREQESPSKVTKVRLMSLRKALLMRDGMMHTAHEHNRVAGHAASHINSHRPRVITGLVECCVIGCLR
jgi:hypothetical protein